MPVVIESFVKNVLCSLIFYTSNIFIEWSEDPVDTDELFNQHIEFIASLCIAYEATCGNNFLFVFLFFFFYILT
jgi:hypothetical protein